MFNSISLKIIYLCHQTILEDPQDHWDQGNPTELNDFFNLSKISECVFADLNLYHSYKKLTLSPLAPGIPFNPLGPGKPWSPLIEIC